MDISHKWLISYYDICWKSCFKGGFLYVSEGREEKKQFFMQNGMEFINTPVQMKERRK